MKKKINFFISLVAMLLCSLPALANRVAPTKPQTVAPQEGGCYWLYNVATGLFLGDEPTYSNRAAVNLNGNNMYLAHEGEYWTLRKDSPSGYYLYSNYTYNSQYTSNSHVEEYSAWTISATDNGYTLKTQQHQNEEMFLGVGKNNAVYGHLTENVDWTFMDAEQAAHYAAELKLYNALAEADDKGWSLGAFEKLYNERAESTNLQLSQAAEQLMQAVEFSYYTGVFDQINDYKMMFNLYGHKNSKFYDSYINIVADKNSTATLTALVETDVDAELLYTPHGDNECTMNVYVDDVLVRTIKPYILYHTDTGTPKDRFYESLTPGKHIIKWVVVNGYNKYEKSATLRNIGVVNCKPIEVHLAEPGSLGTEVLYNVDHVRDVRYLKVVGDMNEEDAVRLSMMTNMLSLDMSEATIAELPNKTFHYDNAPYLHTVILPEGIKSLGEVCFSGSNITSINIPSTVKSIGRSCFYNCNFEEISMPDAVTALGDYAFQGCIMLKDVRYSAGLTKVPNYAFYSCLSLNNCNLPEGITSIGSEAFRDCEFGTFNPVFPSTLKEIGRYAFYNCDGMTEVVIPDAVEEMEYGCFAYSDKLEKVTVSQNMYVCDDRGYTSWFYGCGALNLLTVRSATVMKVKNRVLNDEYRPNITVRVPKYLVNSYKLDPYWYNFGAIEGFSTADTKNWTIHADLTLDSHSRFEGEPNIELKKSNFKIVGDMPMTIDNFTTNTKWYSFSSNYYDMHIDWTSQVMSKCNNINVIGNCYHNSTFTGQKWLCMALPFDTKLGNIVSKTDDVLYSLRVYDGAGRAANGVGANWTRIYDEDYVIPAGTGFIIQTSARNGYESTVQFKSLENDSRNNILNNQDFVKSLELNSCDETVNKGWNLVGNPYLTYYNIHKLNFTAPITVYDSNKNQYFAYSITDDDYALMPTQGFFVQCPGDEMPTIGFPVSGKQLTDEIIEQNAAKGSKVATTRKIIDLTLGNGDNSDKTRVVLNEAAATTYELSCDASKFMSDSKDAVQLWTIDDNGTQYAINERPMADGIVALGVNIPAAGTYTFAMPRCLAQNIVLYDKDTDVETDLSAGDYSFTADAGVDAERFVLRSKAGTATGIVSHAGNLDKVAVDIYSMDGRFLMKANGSFNVESLPQGMYVVRKNGETQKVVIK